MENTDIADMLDEISSLLAFDDANPFRVRAYRNGARTVRQHPFAMRELVMRGDDLAELSTIGKDLAALIEEAVHTGRMRSLEHLRQSVPPIAHDLMSLEGIGPKKAHALWIALGVTKLEHLHRAALDGRVRDVPGFAATSEEKLIVALESALAGTKGRTPIGKASPIAKNLLDWLKSAPNIHHAQIAGSFRRAKDTVGDLDAVISAKDHEDAIEHFTQWPQVFRIVSAGPTRATVILNSGLQVDLRAVSEDSYGATLQYFTGSKAHSIALRARAKRLGMKLNEYGVWRSGKLIPGKSEQDVYSALGLQLIPPELRENRGEIELSAAGKLPKLITENMIKGDLHLNAQNAADATALIEACAALGWSYIAIGPVLGDAPVNAQTFKTLLKQIKQQDKRHKNLTVFTSIEVDIHKDGSCALPPWSHLADMVIGSVQNGFRLSRADQTKRLLTTLECPQLSILSHPTGRRGPRRAPYDVDLVAVSDKAAEKSTAIELSADPDRLDLSDRHCQIAKDAGAKIAISTEAAEPIDLDRMALGVSQARRGWLESKHVLNTRSKMQVQKFVDSHSSHLQPAA